ncbi:hypothetical protein RHSIM_Rhsim07G0228100 [Rhododendron simsii]|uniref:BZIP domain-containing protein n=1 Tax=Rhododendron simsii TaxID=118357 RepID=A0A834LIV3_RHOSS|nr:hypothetical protein RHSIM_Rhsim07G0228100 [Rhododendron simsii]
MNFRNLGFVNEPPGDGGAGGGARPPGTFPLARQSSVYTLTFDEFQSSLGGGGKDFGSMNMDELLKNIWSAEEIQTTMGIANIGQEAVIPSGYLQRQGSLTLPRTLSQKTVDEVWRDFGKESGGGNEANGGRSGGGVGGGGGSILPERQRTLGEITLEEFLVRAGVVREDAQFQGKPNNSALFGDFLRSGANSASGFGFQQMNVANPNLGLMGNRIPDASKQTSNLPVNVNGVRSAQQQNFMPQQQQQQLYPKQSNLAYANPMAIPISTQLGSPRIGGGIVGITEQSINGNWGMSGLGAGGVAVDSPASDGLGKNSGDTSSVSPVPYVFNNGGLRGRRCSRDVEKVVERRQRRMIKNRESAARSRARKQAFTTELEAEVATLKSENEELRKKQAVIFERQKNQVSEMVSMLQGGKRRCLRRTLTGPW